jgi:hypothetical protein
MLMARWHRREATDFASGDNLTGGDCLNIAPVPDIPGHLCNVPAMIGGQ